MGRMDPRDRQHMLSLIAACEAQDRESRRLQARIEELLREKAEQAQKR
jgi:hypothetical protein